MHPADVKSLMFDSPSSLTRNRKSRVGRDQQGLNSGFPAIKVEQRRRIIHPFPANSGLNRCLVPHGRAG